MMQILDSSFLYAFLVENDANHALAVKQFDSSEKYILPEHVLGEIYSVLLYKQGYKAAIDALDWLTTTENFVLERLSDNEFEETIYLLKAQAKKLSFIDAALIVMAKQRGGEILTFDKDMLRSGGRNRK